MYIRYGLVILTTFLFEFKNNNRNIELKINEKYGKIWNIQIEYY